MRVLAVVAHPDDESLFIGGVLARHVLQGDHVRVLALADGESSRTTVTRAGIILRRRQFAAACTVLGAMHELLSVFPDQQADTVPQLEINRAVEQRIAQYQPGLVYTHHVGDLNLDHRRVAEAVLVATRQGPTVYCMTPEFPLRCVGPAWQPSLFVGITNTVALERKIEACLCYAGELRDYPHPRSERALRENAVEAFMEIR